MPTRKSEIFYWVLVALLNPVINGLSFFAKAPVVLVCMLVINLILLPFYIIYSRVIVPRFLFKKKYWWFAAISAAFFVVLHEILFGLYSLVDPKNTTPLIPLRIYFTYNLITILRESVWIFINTILAVTVAYLKRAFDEEYILTALQKDSTLLKLKHLRSQLKPHFLYNTLNSIYSLSLQKSDKTPEVIIKLADIMRYLIYDGAEQKVLLSREIEFIRNYIDIEKTRFTADVRFTVEGENDGLVIEPFLFISFIENAFKHAINNSIDGPFIYITIKIKGDLITLSVVNNTDIDLETQAKRINGRGITGSKGVLEILYPDAYALNIIQTEKQQRKISAIAVKNARERLEILYPDAHTLDVIFNNNVFTVSLLIKLTQQ